MKIVLSMNDKVVVYPSEYGWDKILEIYQMRYGYEHWQLGNYSNSNMNLKIYYLKLRATAGNLPLYYFDDSAAPAVEYPGQATTSIVNNDSAANKLSSCDVIAKNYSVSSNRPFLDTWKITKVHKLVLQPNQVINVVLKQPKFRFKSDHVADVFHPNSKRLLLRVDTDLTADGTVSIVARDLISVKGYAFTGQSLVVKYRQICRTSKLLTSQSTVYVDNRGIAGGVNSNLGTDPRMIGQPMDDDGKDMTDVS